MFPAQVIMGAPSGSPWLPVWLSRFEALLHEGVTFLRCLGSGGLRLFSESLGMVVLRVGETDLRPDWEVDRIVRRVDED